MCAQYVRSDFGLGVFSVFVWLERDEARCSKDLCGEVDSCSLYFSGGMLFQRLILGLRLIGVSRIIYNS